ncbi:hypothetical protein [Nitrospirillum iridis]|uniref:Terminase large subunit gp17-like C-terminal domain-containing protein n=1 Tax=Nitrospirillum iridis TaxID=765888 RepID=A0A7X0AZJ7_9PROT|nr:hypothetical protein [Nitrospirillum iridis]MBB6253024.1 hypothetical protein [Nitrospirillum iridis]
MKTPPEVIRQRLRDEFRFYAAKALKIRTKTGEIVNLRLNAAQEILMAAIEKQLRETGMIRIIILKARQQGLSTMVGGYIYFKTSQKRGQKALVVTHEAEATQTLFTMTRRYHENVPDILRPSTSYSSKKELVFDRLDSAYKIATAGSDSVSRGDTIQQAHLSEVAFWPKNKAREIYNGLDQAIPKAPDTSLFIESTADGVSGLFYELWQGAVAGTNGLLPVFIPWFIMGEYREEPPEGFSRTPAEDDEAARVLKVSGFKLDDAQLFWRRRKVAAVGIDLFNQEYPACAEDAFITSGRPVFEPEVIRDMQDDAPEEPHGRMMVEGDTLIPHSRGPLTCYLPFDEGETYYVGADPGGATGVFSQDYSVAQVLDSQHRQVAVYRDRVHPDHFAEVLNAIGRFFNEARIIVENNNHGLLTCTRLGKDLAYPNFYTEMVVDKITDRETVKLGFTTSVKTKPLVINKLRATIRDRDITLYDRDTLRELQTFITTENGSMEAERGEHDDTVMALALANHIWEGYKPPLVVDDHYYYEAL